MLYLRQEIEMPVLLQRHYSPREDTGRYKQPWLLLFFGYIFVDEADIDRRMATATLSAAAAAAAAAAGHS